MNKACLISRMICPKGNVHLPASKSLSNRVLIIHALSDSPYPVENLAVCDDTRIMSTILSSSNNQFDVGHAGTAMRFLTAFLSRTCGIWELTGSKRMQQRPIAPLVNALNKLGASISYLDKEGFPPLQIIGSYIQGGTITIPATISSQFISALLLIAPYMHNGLTINLEGDMVSRSYIEMTVKLMQRYGIAIDFQDSSITVSPGYYQHLPVTIENDWSSASYLFECIALAKCGKIVLLGLEEHSLQGDSDQRFLWKLFGVESIFTDQGLLLSYQPQTDPIASFEYDFTQMPDLVPTFVVTCAFRGVHFHFTGLRTLRIKECDRILVLQQELLKYGFSLQISEDSISWHGTYCQSIDNPEIMPFEDHRMAMAFAPIVFTGKNVIIRHPEVVNKSFPTYWEVLRQLGVIIHIQS